MKSKVGKLDFDKIILVSVDLCKLSGVVKNNIIKKDVYYNIKTNEIEKNYWS